jgi:hypothetical protein
MSQFLIKLLSGILAELMKLIFSTPSVTTTSVNGNVLLEPAQIDSIFEKAKKSGIKIGAIILLILMASCGTKEIVMTSMYPIEDSAKGFVQLAENEVQGAVVGSDKIGTVKGVGGYIIIHPREFKAVLDEIVRLTKLVEELRKKQND